MPTCVNLKDRFGKRYRITSEDGRFTDPWMLMIPCSKGHICPWGDEYLLACTNYTLTLPRKLKEAGCEIVQYGDDGVNAKFHVKDFAKVARVMRPWKKAQMTEEQKAAARERMLAIRYNPSSFRPSLAQGRVPMQNTGSE